MKNFSKDQLIIALKSIGNDYDLSDYERRYCAIILILEYIDDLEVAKMYQYAITQKD
jgi:hypothetical protein